MAYLESSACMAKPLREQQLDSNPSHDSEAGSLNAPDTTQTEDTDSESFTTCYDDEKAKQQQPLEAETANLESSACVHQDELPKPLREHQLGSNRPSHDSDGSMNASDKTQTDDTDSFTTCNDGEEEKREQTPDRTQTEDTDSFTTYFDKEENSGGRLFHCFSPWHMDLWVHVVSIVVSIVDVGSDISLAVLYYRGNHPVYGQLTTALILAPYVVTTMFGLAIHFATRSRSKLWNACRLFLVILGQPRIALAVEIIYFLFRENKDNAAVSERVVWLSYMALIEAFLEAAPQMCLQLSIRLKDGLELDAIWLQTLALGCSWMSVAWSMTIAYRRMRRETTDLFRVCSLLAYFPWRLFEIGGRVLCIALFASTFHHWVFAVLGTHVVVMTVWNIQTVDEKWTASGVFNSVLAGYIMLFCFPVSPKRSRYLFLFFYLIFYTENFVMFILWMLNADRELWYYEPCLIIVVVFFSLHVLTQLFYYTMCHPSGNIELCPPFECKKFFRSLCAPIRDKSRNPAASSTKEIELEWFDYVFCLLSIVLIPADVCLDLKLAMEYFMDGHRKYGGVTILLMVIPYLVIQMLAIAAYMDIRKGVSRKWWVCRILLLFLGLSPVALKLEYLYHGYMSRPTTADSGNGEEEESCHKSCRMNRDRRHHKECVKERAMATAFLDMFEAFLEAAPQLCFQLFVIFKDKREVDATRYLLIALSVGGMALAALTSYKRMRWNVSTSKEQKLAKLSQVIFLVCRVFEISGRVLCISLFASTFTYLVFPVIIVHLVVMTVWDVRVRDHKWSSSGTFNSVLAGYVMLFHLPVSPRPSRFVHLVFYAIFYGENDIMLTLWLAMTSDRDAWFFLPCIVAVISFSILHICLQLLYYKCCHPNKAEISVTGTEGIKHIRGALKETRDKFRTNTRKQTYRGPSSDSIDRLPGAVYVFPNRFKADLPSVRL